MDLIRDVLLDWEVNDLKKHVRKIRSARRYSAQRDAEQDERIANLELNHEMLKLYTSLFVGLMIQKGTATNDEITLIVRQVEQAFEEPEPEPQPQPAPADLSPDLEALSDAVRESQDD